MDRRRRRAGWSLLGMAALLVAVIVAGARSPGAKVALAQDTAHVDLVAQVGGAASAVALDGDLAVIGIGAQVVVLDIADPGAPREVYRSPVLSAVVADVDVEDHIGYAVHGNQLLVLDLAAPGAPRVLSHEWFYFMDDIRGIVVHDGTAYLLLEQLSPWSLGFIDVRDPAAPRRFGAAPPDYGAGAFGWPREVAVAGHYVYAIDHDSLTIVDVTDPALPVRVAAVDIPAHLYDVDVAGGYVFLAADGAGQTAEDGLLIYDVGDPTHPAAAASLPLPSRRVAVDGTNAYLGLSPAGLAILNVTNPLQPVIVRSEAFADVGDVAASAGRALVAVPYRGVSLIPRPTLSDPATILETWSPAVDVAIDGSHAYVAHTDGLAIVDVSRADVPRTLADVRLAEGATHVTVAGDRVYVTGDDPSVVVLGVADPLSPARAGTIALAAPASLIAAAPGRLVVATERALQVFDTSDPAHAREIGSLAVDSWEPTGLAVAGGHVFVADRPVGLRVYGFADGSRFAEIARLAFRTSEWGGARGIAIDGTRLYVPHGPESIATPADLAPDCPPPPPPETFRILEVDIGDPAAPRWTTDLAPAGWPRGLAVSDGRLFAASGYARYYQTTLIVRDVGAGDGREAEANLPTVPEGVAAAGGRAFVAAGTAGLLVAEVRAGAAPTLTPGPTMPVSPSATRDPDATPSRTPYVVTATPLPTGTVPLHTPTPRPTPTTDCASCALIFLPVARRGE